MKKQISFWDVIKKDVKKNNKNSKGLFIVVCFRIVQYFDQGNRYIGLIGLPTKIFYNFIVKWVMGVELKPQTVIGPGLAIYHGQGLVVHKKTVIGDNVTLRNNTTIGNKGVGYGKGDGCPQIGDNVEVGANTVIIGDIKIGKNAIIGAGSVVIKDVGENVIVAGNPAKRIN